METGSELVHVVSVRKFLQAEYQARSLKA